MDSTIPKPWLTPEQQVEHLKGEGVKFEIVQGSDAITYLRNNNNFFRINQFKKAFRAILAEKMTVSLLILILLCLKIWLLLIMNFVRFFSR